MEQATFAAGCFWGVERAFDGVQGVESTRVGYSGGQTSNPTYKLVCSGETGHAEAVEVIFDPQQISYAELLNIFWEIHDPTTPNRQGPDRGSQYRSIIFFHSQEQAKEARASLKNRGSQLASPIVTEILPAAPFYEAEDYHQKYFKKT